MAQGWAGGSRRAVWLSACSRTARASHVDRLSGLVGRACLARGEEPAHDRIEQLISDRPLMSWVNAVEVYYRVQRDHGRSEADEVLTGLRKTFELDLPGTTLMIETARLKASTPIAPGDCFAIATACARNLTLLTGDPRSSIET